jgi:hypothetical protein
MPKSTYFRQAVLDWLMSTAFPTDPATPYVSLHTADPGLTGASEHGATAAYARVAATPTTVMTRSVNVWSNTAATIEFPQATANYSAQITHFGIWDAATSGNFLGGAALTTARTITTGDIPRFATSALTWTET